MFKGDINSICTIDDFLKIDFKIPEEKDFTQYTEHKNRYGKLINKKDKLYTILNNSIKKEISNRWNDNSDVIMSDVYYCKDDIPFKCSCHMDDYYKYISCILYLNDCQGTTFHLGIGKNKYIEGKKNRLLFFKSKNLYHSVKESYSVRYTLQFHFTLKTFDHYDIIGCSSQFSHLNIPTTSQINYVTNGKSLSLNHKTIHVNIDTKLKNSDVYKEYFFGECNTFIGISKNFMYDANNEACTTRKLREEYCMVSKRSLNHKYKNYFDIKQGRFIEILENEKEIFAEWWSEKYKLNKNKNKIVLFVQNFSKYEYWFGWDENDKINWVTRELKFFNLINSITKKEILIKFHPKMDNEYITYFKTCMGNNNIQYIHNMKLKELFDMVDCCIVNSGSTAVLSMIYGVPTFYINDNYSSIPVNKIACKKIDKIDVIKENDLPDRKKSLDFMFSQIFSLSELQDININGLFSNE
jgi:hypothetical protein